MYACMLLMWCVNRPVLIKILTVLLKFQVKRCSSSWQVISELLAVFDHTVLPATDTSELAPPNPSQKGWYSIYLPRNNNNNSDNSKHVHYWVMLYCVYCVQASVS